MRNIYRRGARRTRRRRSPAGLAASNAGWYGDTCAGRSPVLRMLPRLAQCVGRRDRCGIGRHKAMLARISERRTREGWVGEGIDLFGATPVPAGAGPS